MKLTVPAIVPAAGMSRRMGEPKLLIPFGGRPLLGRVVTALRDGGASPVVVVVPPGTRSESVMLTRIASEAGAEAIVPDSQPPEMRDSVELAMARLEQSGAPDGFMLTPADSPGITAEVVGRLFEAWRDSPGAIIVARAGDKQAHPMILPWDLAVLIRDLPSSQGVNTIVAAHPDRVVPVVLADSSLATDLNTPEDRERWLAHETGKPRGLVSIRLFAIAREQVGRPVIEVELPLPATVAELREAIVARYPALARVIPNVMIAVDAEYATETTPIVPGVQVALIPPVSGG